MFSPPPPRLILYILDSPSLGTRVFKTWMGFWRSFEPKESESEVVSTLQPQGLQHARLFMLHCLLEFAQIHVH